MFENFPYTNMHQLNLDWIVKIAKDFLDQYTHIQQLIADGEESLQNLTEEGLQQLQDKADALEQALQAWYTEHSEDIAQQLASALSDLNDWYTVHQDYLNETLLTKTAEFNTAAEAKTALCLESIPQDYTDIDQTVKSIHNVASQLFTLKSMCTQSGYINANGEEQSNSNYVRSYFVPIAEMREGIIEYFNLWGNLDVVNIISAYDANKDYISGVIATGVFQTSRYTPPANAKYIRISTLKQYITEGKSSIRITPSFINDEWMQGIIAAPLIEDNRIFQFIGYIQNGSDFYGNDAFVRTGYIPAAGNDVFRYYNLIGNADAISIVSVFYLNKTPLSHIQSTGSYQSGSVVMPQDGYIMFACNKTYIDSGYAYVRFENNVNNRFNINLQTRRYITKNVKICTIGDSITNQTWTSDKWQNELISDLKMNPTFQNLAFDSITVSTSNGLNSETILSQIDNDAEYVIIMAGVNDWAWNVPIGDKTYDNVDATTYFGACNLMFRRILGIKTSARVIAFGNTFACYPNRENFTDPTGFKNNEGLIALDYSRAMMEAAQLNGIEHYDIGGNLCINQGNYQSYYRDSGYYVHPNAIMTVMIASFMARCIG